jgi:serine/threonine-protein kinase
MIDFDLKTLWERMRSARLVRVLGVYFVASWAVLQAIDMLSAQFAMPRWFFPVALGLLVVGVPIVTATAVIQSVLVPAPCDDDAPAVVSPPATSRLGRWFTWPRAIMGGVLVFVVLGSLGATVVYFRNQGDGLRSDAIAVMPFHIVGTDEDLWREGMVDLLSTALDATGQFHSSDPRAVLNRWRLVSRPDELPEPLKAADVAGQLGAGKVILGSMIRTGQNQVRLAADVYSVRWVRKEASVQVEGREDQITTLVDQLSLELLRSIWRGEDVPEIQISALTTSSIPALRAYLEGERAFRHSQFSDAQKAYTRAIDADSTFAMAYFRLAQTYGWFMGLGAEQVPTLMATAEKHSQGLPERDSLLIRGWKITDVDGNLDAIPLFRGLVTRYPDDLEAWHGLGDAIFHMGSQAGLPITASIQPLERTLAIDPTFAPALIHLIEIAYREGDGERARRWTDQYLALDSTSLYAKSFRLVTALSYGSAADSIRAATVVDTADSDLLGWMMGRMRLSGADLDVFETVALEAAEPRHSDEERAMAYWNLAVAHIRHGQSAAAADYFTRSASLGGDGYQQGIYNIVVTASELGVSVDTASKILLARLGTERRRPRNALTVAAIQNGAEAEALAMIDQIEERADTAEARGNASFARSLRGEAITLRGRVAAAHDSIDTAISQLRTGLSMINATWSWSRDLDRYSLAQLIQDRGGEEEAIAIYGSLYWNPWAEAIGYMRRAELHERRGETEAALRYYARFVTLWRDADPHLQPQVEAAKRALERLRDERLAS